MPRRVLRIDLAGHWWLSIIVVIGILGGIRSLPAGDLVVEIKPGERVARIGVVRRFDSEGGLVRPVDPKAKYDAPYLDAVSTDKPAHFTGLQPGVYDVVLFLNDGTRIEGYHWPSFGEFEAPDDPAFRAAPPEEVATTIRKQISQTRLYENKVTPLAIVGDDVHVRVLMQLLRDDPTSFDAEFGAPVATLRYEVWQYTNQFGAWTRDKQSKVLHRILEAKSALHKHTWLWEVELGGVRVSADTRPGRVEYRLPDDLRTLPGLRGGSPE
jgi:hypothetical protein